ncbi:major facilitator superfamily domain-containing protein [Clohesyomyces aquaticus]|uniref:Major facilitator superfamily domain-containing protein n=1 Tax=Clohesyomyces aquaticus TaxID=1231657 RepID=A0A1Y1ZEE8_9PLEO|nr:major facilitator superfamily domain-containing protein [Clohesyomyces aquaticus]
MGYPQKEGGEESQSIVVEQLEENTVSQDRLVLSWWKLQLLNLCLCISLFLSTVEITVVSTAVVPISDALHGFSKSPWTINAYLVAYGGVLVITAKLSDIFGRRSTTCVCLVIFAITSIACGVSQTIDQLIVFRALQGVGGGGIYTMVFVILPEMCTPAQYPLYVTIVSSVFALSNLLGPILGGVISDRSTWRWIFFLNVPITAVAIILLFFAIPSHFPYARPRRTVGFSVAALKRLDIPGTFLILACSTLFITAIQEGGMGHAWSSALVLGTLISSVCLWGALLWWSRYQATHPSKREPTLPWRILTNRVAMGVLMEAFWVGALLYTAIVLLPQRFQVVNGTTPLTAGYRLLPLTLTAPVGSLIGGYLMQNMHQPPLYVLLGGAIIQTLGAGLLVSLPSNTLEFAKAGYGYQAITGIGLGITSATVVMCAVIVFEERDIPVGMGAIGQFRTFGGSIGISVCSNVLNRSMLSKLKSQLSLAQISSLQVSAGSINEFPATLQRVVRLCYAEGFKRQMICLTAFGAVSIVTLLLMLERRPRRQH